MALTPAQLTTFKADILANPNQTVIDALAADDVVAIRDWYNGTASPDYFVWQSVRSLEEVGQNLDGNNLGDITAANAERVGIFFQSQPGGVDPSLADRRAFFDDVFSGASGAETRANLAALWQRITNEIEKLLSAGTGAGTSIDPDALGFEGEASTTDVREAINLP